jgi:DNA recombination protein RmuC
LYERMGTLVEHFEEIGSALKKAIDAYNRAVGSMEFRILPSIRKFRELEITGAGEIPVLAQADHTPRAVTLPSGE